MVSPFVDCASHSSPFTITVPSGVSVVSTRAAAPTSCRSRVRTFLRSQSPATKAMNSRPAMLAMVSIWLGILLEAIEPFKQISDPRFQISEDKTRNSKVKTGNTKLNR